MSKKRYNAEEIIHKLRRADVLLSQGKTVSQACKQIGVSAQTYYRWRKAYGGMKVDQARRLKELEAENARMKRAVADLTVDKLIPDMGRFRPYSSRLNGMRVIGHCRKLSFFSLSTRWLDHFIRYTVSNYAGRFAGYEGEYFETQGQEDAPHDTVLVKTTLFVPKDEDVGLSYRLRSTAQGWAHRRHLPE